MKEARCDKCGRLLGIFEVAEGQVKCPRCKNIQLIIISAMQESRKEIANE